MEPGSSPLTRGTHVLGRKVHASRRFIPAYAGNSGERNRDSVSDTVHPRLRGELIRPLAFMSNSNGSSPLTRGTHANALPAPTASRFIPAYAGNSLSHSVFCGRSSVHPRLRGELTALVLAFFGAFGSSPLTRGTPDIGQRCIDPNRFIPAYAGNSIAGSRQVLPYPVHPRLRGELGYEAEIVTYSAGSSPLTRGTRTLSVSDDMAFRFIPAYAGNSEDFLDRRYGLPVHPRLRGELRVP